MALASGFGAASRAVLQRPPLLTGTPGTGTLRKASMSMGGTDPMNIGTALATPNAPGFNPAGGAPSAVAPSYRPGIIGSIQRAGVNAIGAQGAPVPGTPGASLDDRYSHLMDSTGGMVGNDYGQYQDAYTGFGGAIDQFTGAAGQVGSFQPTETMGVGNAITPDFSRYTPQTIDSLNLGQYLSQAGSSAATQGVDFSNIENFDPSGAINTYANGAWGSIKANLGDQLNDIRNQDARLGRLNTGFFDKDRGTVINRATDQFTNNLAQTAVQGAGLKLNALTSAGGLKLSKAGQIDAATRAGGASGLGAALQIAGMNEGGRQFDVNQDYTRASGTNAFNLNRGNFIDTSRQNAGNAAAGYYGQAAGYAGQRAGMAQGQYNTDFGNYAGLVTGGLDRRTGQQNVDQQNKVNKKGTTLGAIGTGATIGSAFGPWGTVAGGVIGGIASLF